VVQVERGRSDSEFLTSARVRAVIGGLALVGLWSVGPRIVQGRSIATELAFIVSLVATGTLTFLLVDAARALARFRGGFRRHLIASGIEGIILFGYGLVAEPFALLEGPRSLAFAGGLASLVVAHAVLVRRSPKLGRAVVVAAGLAGWIGHLLTNPSLYGSVHAAACVVIVMSGARIASFGSASDRWSLRSFAALSIGACVTAQILLSFPETRARFRWESPTATALAKPLLVLADFDRDGASSLLHGYDCAPFDASRGAFMHERMGDGIDQDCDGIDPRKSTSAPAARGAGDVAHPDVLVLSVDALRADEAHRLVRVRRELGPIFEFTSAVAPSVRTMNSFAAIMRGRTLDELPFGHESLRSTLTSNELPTIGNVFAAAGYRATFVPTHSYLAPRTAVVSGFEFLRRESMPYDDPSHQGLDAMLDADDALALLLEAARSTPGPVFAWAHLMETHAPYRASRDRVYGSSRADYRHALADQDRRLAEAIRSFRAIRGPSAIVVILGDHGEAFGEHGDYHHSSSLHAEHARVPLLIHVPGTLGRRISAPVSIAALASTLAELAAVTGNEGSFTLRSLVPCLGDDARCPEVAVTELFSLARPGDVSMRAYTTRGQRTIVDRAHDVARTYDRGSDPTERHPRTTNSREAIRSIANLDDGR